MRLDEEGKSRMENNPPPPKGTPDFQPKGVPTYTPRSAICPYCKHDGARYAARNPKTKMRYFRCTFDGCKSTFKVPG